MILRRYPALVLTVVALLSLATSQSAQAPVLAATPPMGWNSWNHFAGRIDDATVRAQADAMVSSGMKAAGYTYINIDDTWEGERDSQGIIHANEKFPDMKALANYVHSKGLKLGIYSSPGPQTCARFEGSYGHEEQDAMTYAAWGIDYLKYDLCSFNRIMAGAATPEIRHQMMLDAYTKMHNALLKTRRPIVFSLCQYGNDAVWEWGPSVGGNAWRTTDDIQDRYASMANIGFSQAGLAKFAAPGHWNDPDMLEVGNGGMTLDEYRTHMSLWAILAAPLLAGNDLTKMSPDTIALLTNREVLAINQDSAGQQGDRVWSEGPALEIWARPLADGSKAVGLFNRLTIAKEMDLDFSKVGFAGHVHARDIWAAKDLGELSGTFHVTVPPHGVVLLRVSK
jgi:alpha-galactosidase